MTVSEMIASNPKLWNTKKSLMRSDHTGEPGIRSVQIAGAEPEMMAQAAQHNVENGAEIIDINMGCPAKKVTGGLSGILGWATYAAASALVGLVLGTVLFFVLHKVFGLGHGKEEGAH